MAQESYLYAEGNTKDLLPDDLPPGAEMENEESSRLKHEMEHHGLIGLRDGKGGV